MFKIKYLQQLFDIDYCLYLLCQNQRTMQNDTFLSPNFNPARARSLPVAAGLFCWGFFMNKNLIYVTRGNDLIINGNGYAGTHHQQKGKKRKPERQSMGPGKHN